MAGYLEKVAIYGAKKQRAGRKTPDTESVILRGHKD